MKCTVLVLASALAVLPLQADDSTPSAPVSSHWTVIAWNDLGMHCMDSDYTVFSILPPFNVLHAQLIDPNGKLVKSPTGLSCSYLGTADPTGSINTTSYLKTTFWQNVKSLFGVQL